MILVFFVAFCLFFVEGIKILDPDFGWQLRNGQTFLTTGIFYKDPYSYTMPSFPVVSHEWFSDVIIALIYGPTGFYGLSAIFTLVFLVPLFFVFYFTLTKEYPKKFISNSILWHTSILIFSIGILFNYYYVRPQVFSWALWSILALVIVSRKRFVKYRFYLPILFFIWANLHGGFGLGIAIVFFLAVYSSVAARKIQIKNFLAAILCLLATFINPFGITLWREVLSTFFSSNVRANVVEWRSIITFGFTFLDFLLFFEAAISTVLIWYFWKKINLELIIINFLLLFIGMSSLKNMPFWMIFNLVLFPQLIYALYKKISKNKISVSRFKKAGVFVFVSSIVLAFSLYYMYMTNVDVSFDFYPKNAVAYLANNLPQGQIFSQHAWGGYLIWQLPQKKVFIDGRMSVWSWNGNKAGETNNALTEYNNIRNEKVNFNDVAKKYNIDTVLWPKASPIQKSLDYRLDELICKHIQLEICKTLKGRVFEKILFDDGWKVIYQDKVAVIYKK